uniref:Uncharacterized protein n=1 Tax=Arundo donax TaxID=35708 RepID=A0A0A9BWU6_ARUDO
MHRPKILQARQRAPHLEDILYSQHVTLVRRHRT